MTKYHDSSHKSYVFIKHLSFFLSISNFNIRCIR